MLHNEQLDYLRHSCAHLLAAAVMELWPQTKRTIGPPIEDGFYYDFDFGDVKISEEDLPRIEEKMREILPTWTGFERREVTADEAREVFKDNPYKLELIDEFSGEGQSLTLYQSGNYVDLCRGGHSENPREELKHFKLLSIAGAYWRGSEKNKMLTRIYGTCFSTQKELDDYLKMQEEAKERDHKKLGKELDLFTFSETVGKGLPLWTEKGATIRRELERFIVDEEIRRGYLHVRTPDIAKLDLYKKSGHYPHYKDSMYTPIKIDEEEFMLRPMSCPHHFELYLRKPHSYRELPMRIAELVQLYRYEQSGELSGLQRVRTFCLADAHIICASEEQAVAEIGGALDLIEYITGIFGLVHGTEYWYRLSLGDRANSEKYYKNDAGWEKAENLLRKHLQSRNSHFVEAPGEAAFYGPKVDIQMKNVNGKEDTAFTVQYDLCMPERFDLKYNSEDGTEKRAVVVHRSSIGAIERIMAFLIEHFAGAFPVWLSPVQVLLAPVSENHLAFAEERAAALRAAGIRVDVDRSNETVGKKIRNAELQKVPYTVVLGDKEKDGGEWQIRVRSEKEQPRMPEVQFVAAVQEKIAGRALLTIL